MRKITMMAATAALMLAAGLSLNLGQVHAADAMPAVGQSAPGFTLPSQTGAQISLSSFAGKWVVLYFYPKDMTPGCTIEAHNYQAAQEQFTAKNAVILGVSVDSADSHQAVLRTKENLTFRLLVQIQTKRLLTRMARWRATAQWQAGTRSSSIRRARSRREWTSVSPQTTVPIVLAAIPGGPAMAVPSKLASPEMRRPITDSVKPPPPINNLPPQQ